MGPIKLSGRRAETLTQSAQYLPFIFPVETMCSNTLEDFSEVTSKVEITVISFFIKNLNTRQRYCDQALLEDHPWKTPKGFI